MPKALVAHKSDELLEKQILELKESYFISMGKVPNIEHPQTYTEKIQWMKFYDSTKLKSDLADLRNAHSITLEKVLDNKEQIKNLFARLEDIIKGYKDGDENLQKQIDELKKYINQKLDELAAQIEILLKAPPGAGKSDLSALSDLLKKINNLEREFNEFVTKVIKDMEWEKDFENYIQECKKTG